MKHNWGRCIFVFAAILLQLCYPAICLETASSETVPKGIANLRFFQQAYPDISFQRSYDSTVGDWLITLVIPEKNNKKRIVSFYWADGALLPKSELKNKAYYDSILYKYPLILEDPADFSEEKKALVKQLNSEENLKHESGTAMFFFDAVYDASSRSSLEQHLVKVTFLGKRATVHERIQAPLERVEKRILSLSKYNKKMKEFVDELKSSDAYYWRIIAGTSRKSFHSLGIALDILPVSTHGKQIYWGWAKDKYPDSWMLVPLEKRWIPPAQIIKIFEEEGFVWGGKWHIYDNMHFEYRPELILFRDGM